MTPAPHSPAFDMDMAAIIAGAARQGRVNVRHACDALVTTDGLEVLQRGLVTAGQMDAAAARLVADRMDRVKRGMW